jgi:hypothetical protein
MRLAELRARPGGLLDMRARYLAPRLAIALLFTLATFGFPDLAAAKGGGPLTSYVAVTGPGLDHPWVLQAIGTGPKGYRGAGAELFMNLATRLGMLGEGASAKPMSPPGAARLGSRFDVYFFMSCLPNFGRCRSSIHEALYPFATPSPLVNLARGQDQLFAKMFGRRNVFTGWVELHAEGNVVREQLLALGGSMYPRSSALPSQAHQAANNTRAPWFLVAPVILLVSALLAWTYRSRERRAAG